MKKYLFIFKSEIMSNLHYLGNIAFGFIGCFLILFVFLNLWQYMYNDPEEMIHGYNMFQIIWYIVITEIIYISVSGRKMSKKIGEDVRGGNIAYNITRPYSYINFQLFSYLGSVFVRLLIYVILGMLTGLLFLGSFPQITIYSVLIVMLTVVFAIAIHILLIIFIGLVSFIMEDSQPLYWLYSKVILLMGVFFPLEFFPAVVQPFIKLSPVYAISYGPARLFVDFSWDLFFKVLLSQTIYLIIAYLLCLLIYRKGVKNLNVNGG